MRAAPQFPARRLTYRELLKMSRSRRLQLLVMRITIISIYCVNARLYPLKGHARSRA